MATFEATRIVFSRIQNLDPENATKIMGLLLIQDHGEKEMIRLAFGPEALFHSVFHKARKDLGLPSNSPPSTSPFLRSNPIAISLQHSSSSSSSFSSRLSNLPPTLTIPNPSSAISTCWAAGLSYEHQNPDDQLINPNNFAIGSSSASMNSASLPFYGNRATEQVVDVFQLQDQLSFLHDGPMNPDLFYHQQDLSFSPNGADSVLFPSYASGNAHWGDTLHRRSCSVNDVCFGSDDPNSGFEWRPCLYYPRGYCKNGTSCRFLHEGHADYASMVGSDGSPSKLETTNQQCHELLRSKSAQQQRLAAASQLMSASANSSFPYSPKCMNFLQQQQNETQRALMMGEDLHKLSRSPRNDSSVGGGFGISCPASRQIYLTFPADSTFREEDVSNYFNIYGPVQDVRIPYQQKRMFGFVTFVYAETVKSILAKGNPHFVCDARVLVKPYKEKGKVVQEKKQQFEKVDFSPCDTPTGVDSREPFDVRLGPRMFYNPQEILWRRKLEQQAELEKALEPQSRRLMNLQLLDVKKHHRASSNGTLVESPLQSPSMFNEVLPSIPQENNLTTIITSADEYLPQPALVKELTTNVDHGKGKESPRNEARDLFENFEHNLPDSPFASPTKAAAEDISGFSNVEGEAYLATPLRPGASTLDVGTFKSFNCQVPRYTSNHGAIGMYTGSNVSKCPVGI